MIPGSGNQAVLQPSPVLTPSCQDWRYFWIPKTPTLPDLWRWVKYLRLGRKCEKQLNAYHIRKGSVLTLILHQAVIWNLFICFFKIDFLIYNRKNEVTPSILRLCSKWKCVKSPVSEYEKSKFYLYQDANFLPIRLAKIDKFNDKLCWWGCGEIIM